MGNSASLVAAMHISTLIPTPLLRRVAQHIFSVRSKVELLSFQLEAMIICFGFCITHAALSLVLAFAVLLVLFSLTLDNFDFMF